MGPYRNKPSDCVFAIGFFNAPISLMLENEFVINDGSVRGLKVFFWHTYFFLLIFIFNELKNVAKKSIY